MGILALTGSMAFLYLIYLSLLVVGTQAQNAGEAKLVYEWTSLDFDWPSETFKNEALANRTYIPQRNMVAGIKAYKDSIYVTVPRWFWSSGHPVTLAKVVVTATGEVKLRPYPTWAAQKQGDCNCLQYVQGMEIDPNTGLMYVVDTGRVGLTENLCPAKIVVYDLVTDSHRKYELPASVASPTSNFLNDIVLDYIGGKVRFAYISDANDARLVVFDFNTNKSWTIQHSSMGIESNGAENITINGKMYNIPVALDGLAMSPDFQYLYYCSLAGFNLYQIPTSSLRYGTSDGIRLVGSKVSQSGGIGYGSKFLYYGALGLNAVYYWDLDKDMAKQSVGVDKVTLATQTLLVRNDSSMQWPDTFGFDTYGWLWFVSNRLQVFRDAKGLPDGGDAFMRVWKVYVNETGYLDQAAKRTQGTILQPKGNGSDSGFSSMSRIFLFHVFMFVGVIFVVAEINRV